MPPSIPSARIFGAIVGSLALFSGREAKAQILLYEDFSSNSLPPSLEVAGPNAAFAGGAVAFPGSADAFRTYLRTVSANFYSLGSFMAEITLTTGSGIAFFGLGSGDPNAAFFNEPGGPTINLRLHPNNVAGGASDSSDGPATLGSAVTFGNAGSGVHRLRLVWDFLAQTATFSLDTNYTGGPFVADLTSGVINGADNGFSPSNARLFFGGAGGASFDNFTVTAVPEPGTYLAGLSALGVALLAVRRRRKPAVA